MTNELGRSVAVVGSGPNGLMAAVVLAGAGCDVTVFEAASEPGGGLRTAELTVPGARHDVCSAIHPLAVGSPAFRSLRADLERHGLRWVHSPLPLAHPLDGRRAAVLRRGVDDTADGLGVDAAAWRRLFGPLVDAGDDLIDGLLSPFSIPPAHPLTMARFGLPGIRSASSLAGARFDGEEAAALFAGLAGHSILPLSDAITAGYGLMLGALAHHVGWPLAEGGSASIAAALVGLLAERGGRVECNRRIESLAELDRFDDVLLDVTPRQLLAIGGDRLPARYRGALERYRYGAGVFKLDLALSEPIPWADPDVGRAATVHLGGTLAEIAESEQAVGAGRHADRPYVLLAQQSRFDRTRAPDGIETVWAYCHVPNGSTVDMTARIEDQIERFAPGFRDTIVARHTMNTEAMERHDANYIGGDINGGLGDLRQFVIRPHLSLRPWRTPLPGVYLCSSSTPPGGGVHGMCGWHAAHALLRDRRRR